MDTQSGKIEPVTISDILGLATWSRERSSEELQGFINRRHAAIENLVEDE